MAGNGDRAEAAAEAESAHGLREAIAGAAAEAGGVVGDPPGGGRRVTLRLEIPARTIFRILLVLAALWVLAQVWVALFEVFLGILIALALLPVVGRLERRGLSRNAAVAVVIGGSVAAIALVVSFVVPRAVNDAQDLWDNLPEYVATGLSWLEGPQPGLYNDAVEWAEQQQEGGSDTAAAFDVRGFLGTGTSVLAGIGNGLVVLVIAAYVLVDRDYRMIRWAVRDLAPRTQRKVWRTIPAVTQVVSGYVLGQGFICLCFGVYSFIVLSILGVPSALILALIALFADAIPLVGIIVATVPAVVLGFTQSPTAGLIVLVTFIGYQQFENYVLSPRVFGRTLDISPLAILIAVLVGQEVFGIIGVILALPIAASIPVLERVWLGGDPDDDDDPDARDDPGDGAEDGDAAGAEPAAAAGAHPPGAAASADDGGLGHFPGPADVAEAMDEGGPELARPGGSPR